MGGVQRASRGATALLAVALLTLLATHGVVGVRTLRERSPESSAPLSESSAPGSNVTAASPAPAEVSEGISASLAAEAARPKPVRPDEVHMPPNYSVALNASELYGNRSRPEFDDYGVPVEDSTVDGFPASEQLTDLKGRPLLPPYQWTENSLYIGPGRDKLVSKIVNAGKNAEIASNDAKSASDAALSAAQAAATRVLADHHLLKKLRLSLRNEQLNLLGRQRLLRLRTDPKLRFERQVEGAKREAVETAVDEVQDALERKIEREARYSDEDENEMVMRRLRQLSELQKFVDMLPEDQKDPDAVGAGSRENALNNAAVQAEESLKNVVREAIGELQKQREANTDLARKSAETQKKIDNTRFKILELTENIKYLKAKQEREMELAKLDIEQIDLDSKTESGAKRAVQFAEHEKEQKAAAEKKEKLAQEHKKQRNALAKDQKSEQDTKSEQVVKGAEIGSNEAEEKRVKVENAKKELAAAELRESLQKKSAESAADKRKAELAGKAIAAQKAAEETQKQDEERLQEENLKSEQKAKAAATKQSEEEQKDKLQNEASGKSEAASKLQIKQQIKEGQEAKTKAEQKLKSDAVALRKKAAQKAISEGIKAESEKIDEQARKLRVHQQSLELFRKEEAEKEALRVQNVKDEVAHEASIKRAAAVVIQRSAGEEAQKDVLVRRAAIRAGATKVEEDEKKKDAEEKREFARQRQAEENIKNSKAAEQESKREEIENIESALNARLSVSFDENKSGEPGEKIWMDVSGKMNNAHLGLGAAIAKDGALDVSQTDKAMAAINNVESLRPKGPFSIEAWVLPTEYRALTGGGYIFSMPEGFSLEMTPDGRVRVYCRGLDNPGYHYSHRRLSNDTQSHVAYVWDGQAHRIYIDGKLDVSFETSGKPAVSDSNPIFMGAFAGGSHKFWGKIYVLRFYTFYALTSEDVAHRYQLERARFLGPVIEQRLERMRKATALFLDHRDSRKAGINAWVDLSGKGNDVVLQDGARFTDDGALDVRSTFAAGSIRTNHFLEPTHAFAVEAWIQPNSLSVTSDGGIIISRVGMWYLELGPYGHIRVFCYGPKPSNYITSNAVISIDMIWHVVYSFDGASHNIYINGKLDTSVRATGTVEDVSPGNDVWIGSYGRQQGSNKYYGIIYQLRYFNDYALHAPDVQTLYERDAKHFSEL